MLLFWALCGVLLPRCPVLFICCPLQGSNTNLHLVPLSERKFTMPLQDWSSRPVWICNNNKINYFLCKSPDTQGLKATLRCGLQLFYSRGRCHLLLGLNQVYTIYSPNGCTWVSSIRSLAGRTESTTSPILRSKCHERDSNQHSADQTPEIKSCVLNRSAISNERNGGRRTSYFIWKSVQVYRKISRHPFLVEAGTRWRGCMTWPRVHHIGTYEPIIELASSTA